MKKILLIIATFLSFYSITHASTLQVIQGGTGATSFTAGQCIIGNGKLAFTSSPCSSGGGSSGGTFSTTTSSVTGQLINYPNNTTDIVTVGGTATTSAKFYFDPNTLIGFVKGFLGIGTSSPYAPLSVVGSGGIVAENLTATSTTAVSTFAGKVGLGTSTPNAQLSINGLGQTSSSFDPSGNLGGTVNLIDSGNAAGSGGSIVLSTTNSGLSKPMVSIKALGTNSSATRALASGDLAISMTASTLDSTMTERLRLTSGGKLGIGTTSPYAPLSVAGQVVASNFTATTSTISTFPYASTTALSATTLCLDSCITSWPSAGGGSFPFTTTTNFNATTNATTSPLWLQNGLQASSTAYIDNLDVKTYNSRKIVVEGDSLSSFDSNKWSYYIASSSPYFAQATQVNYAVSGETVSQMITEYATEGHVSRPTKLGDDYWFFLEGGINDIGSAQSATTTYARLKSLWGQARSDGYKVVAFTVMRTLAHNASLNQVRLDLNRLILSDPSQYDYVIQPDLVLDPATDSSFFSDQTHTNPAGGQIFAEIVAKTINKTQPWILSSVVATTSTPVSYNLWLNPTGATSIGTSTTNGLFSVFGTSSQPAIARFITSASSTALSILNTGQVGVGTTSVETNVGLSAWGTIPLLLGRNGVGQHQFTVTNSAVAGNNTLQLSSIGGVTGGFDLLNVSTVEHYLKYDGTAYHAGKLGIGTTSPYAPLSVAGQVVADYYTATSSTASQLPYASSTAQTTGTLYVSGLSTARIPYVTTGGKLVTSSGLQFDDTLNKITTTYASTTAFSTGAFAATGTATSTFANGIALSGGCLSINGSCLIGGTGGTGDVSAAASLADTGVVIGDGGSKGVKSANGMTVSSEGYLTLNNQININGAWTQFQATQAGTDLNFKTVAGTGDIIFSPNASDLMWLSDSGQVGIGTSSPFAKLSVSGDGYFNGNLRSSNITATGTITTNALTLSGVTGSTQCLQANSSGVVSGTGSACGAGSGGGSGGTWATTTSTASGVKINHPLVTNDVVVIGGTATSSFTGNPIWFNPNADGSSDATFHLDANTGTSSLLNVIFGGNAGQAITTGSHNTGIGDHSMRITTTGSEQTFTGLNSGYGANGFDNVGFGNSTLYHTNNNNNSALGQLAGFTNVVGDNNVFIGTEAGYTTNASSSILIGAFVDSPYPATNSILNIGNVLYGSGMYNNPVIQASGGTLSSTPTTDGRIAIGTSTPYARLSVWGQSSGKIIEATNSASTTVFSVSGTGFGTTTLSGLTISGSATSTSNVGMNITGGCYAISGTCLSGGTGSGTVTSINASGGTTGLSFSGGPVTGSGTLTLAGTLGIANGGTNATSFGSGGMIYYDGTRLTGCNTAGQCIVTTNGNLGVGSSSPSTSYSLSTSKGIYAAGNSIFGGTITSTSTAANVLPYASTTGITASSVFVTNIFDPLGSSGLGGQCLRNSAGLFAVWGACDASVFSFTPTTNFNANTNATTSPLWLKNGFQASTTSYIDYASTTAISAKNIFVNNHPILDTFDKAFTLASSTPDYTKGYKIFANATSTYIVWNPSVAVGMTKLYCKTVAGTGVAAGAIGNGTASTTVIATTSGVEQSSTVTWTARQNVYIAVGTADSTVDGVTCTGTFYNQ